MYAHMRAFRAPNAATVREYYVLATKCRHDSSMWSDGKGHPMRAGAAPIGRIDLPKVNNTFRTVLLLS